MMNKEYEQAVRELVRHRKNHQLEIGLYRDTHIVTLYIRDDYDDLGEMEGVICGIEVTGNQNTLKNLQLAFSRGRKSLTLSKDESPEIAKLLKQLYQQNHLPLIHVDEWGGIIRSTLIKDAFQETCHPPIESCWYTSTIGVMSTRYKL